MIDAHLSPMCLSLVVGWFESTRLPVVRTLAVALPLPCVPLSSGLSSSARNKVQYLRLFFILFPSGFREHYRAIYDQTRATNT